MFSFLIDWLEVILLLCFWCWSSSDVSLLLFSFACSVNDLLTRFFCLVAVWCLLSSFLYMRVLMCICLKHMQCCLLDYCLMHMCIHCWWLVISCVGRMRHRLPMTIPTHPLTSDTTGVPDTIPTSFINYYFLSVTLDQALGLSDQIIVGRFFGWLISSSIFWHLFNLVLLDRYAPYLALFNNALTPSIFCSFMLLDCFDLKCIPICWDDKQWSSLIIHQWFLIDQVFHGCEPTLSR